MGQTIDLCLDLYILKFTSFGLASRSYNLKASRLAVFCMDLHHNPLAGIVVREADLLRLGRFAGKAAKGIELPRWLLAAHCLWYVHSFS